MGAGCWCSLLLPVTVLPHDILALGVSHWVLPSSCLPPCLFDLSFVPSSLVSAAVVLLSFLGLKFPKGSLPPLAVSTLALRALYNYLCSPLEGREHIILVYHRAGASLSHLERFSAAALSSLAHRPECVSQYVPHLGWCRWEDGGSFSWAQPGGGQPTWLLSHAPCCLVLGL